MDPFRKRMDSPMEAMYSSTGAVYSSPQGSPWTPQGNPWIQFPFSGKPMASARKSMAFFHSGFLKEDEHILKETCFLQGNKLFGTHRESFRKVMDSSRKAMGSIGQCIDPSITYMDSLRKPMYSYRKLPDYPRNLMHSLRISQEINGCLGGSRDS